MASLMPGYSMTPTVELIAAGGSRKDRKNSMTSTPTAGLPSPFPGSNNSLRYTHYKLAVIFYKAKC